MLSCPNVAANVFGQSNIPRKILQNLDTNKFPVLDELKITELENVHPNWLNTASFVSYNTRVLSPEDYHLDWPTYFLLNICS